MCELNTHTTLLPLGHQLRNCIIPFGWNLENFVTNSASFLFWRMLVRQVCSFYRNASINRDAPPGRVACSLNSQRFQTSNFFLYPQPMGPEIDLAF